MKALKMSLVFILLVGWVAWAPASAGPDIKLRFLEGAREGVAPGPTAVTSSYEKIVRMRTVPLNYSLDSEMAKIKKVFNLKDIKLITEADLQWPARGDKAFQIIQFDGKEYLILITPKGDGPASKFRVEVFEQLDKAKTQTNLLDTEFKLPADETVVLGFEDSKSTAYFLYLTWPAGGLAGGVEGGVIGGVMGGVQGGVEGGIEGGVVGGVVGGALGGVEGGLEEKPLPKLIKKVDPVYPEIARQSHVEGAVVLEITIDVKGRVAAWKVLHSIPLLDQAAIDAVKQWVYEPLLEKGQPKPAIATVTIAFKLDGGKGKVEEVAQGAVRATGDIQPPKLIKVVEPVYPEIARTAGVEGVVIAEATTDIHGRVVKVKILRSVPLLDQAAIDAVKQWVYEPMMIKGEPKGVIFTTTVKFRLDEGKKKGEVVSVSAVDEEFAKGAVKVEGETAPPPLIKEVSPVYPEDARKARVEGVVILAVRTDIKGRVKAVKLLRSVPKLDQAAIDAVKQWIYKPFVVKGKPVEAVFTVTVRFRLK